MGWIAKSNNNEALEQVKADAEKTYRQNPHHPDEFEVTETLVMPAPQRPLTFTRPELRYFWKEGDTIEAVALKHGADAEEILDANLIEEHELQPGDELKIPKKQVIKRSNKIRYEALERPVEMHVNQPEGIKKYAFGNAKKTDQISGSGHYPLGTHITIHGIAHVPVEDGEEILAYYMDNHAFGDFKNTGKIAWNLGYAWSELSEGKYVPVEEQPPEEPVKTILDEPDEPLTMFDDIADEEPEPEPEPAVEPPKNGILMPLNPDYTPEKYLYEADIEIHELYERHEPIKRRANDPVWIIGTFRHEGEEFYQPGKYVAEVVQSGLLWPIPMDAVLPEEEVFDFSIKRRPMTKQERWFELLMRASANYTRLVIYIKQKRNKE